MSSDFKDLWESAGGKAPDHWKFVRFEDLLADSKSIAVGVMYPGEHSDSGTPLIKVSDVKNGKVVRKPDFCIDEKVNHEYRRTMLKGNELLITLVGNPGDCAIVDESMKGWNAARALAVVRLKDPSLRPWVRYVLLSSTAKHLINARLNTTVQKTLNLKDVKSLPIPIASSDEIASIVDIASILESKINLNQEINQTLEQMAQAIFKSWFVDFEPVKAKIAALDAGGSDEDALIAAMQAISGKDADQLATMQAEKPEQYDELRATAELFPTAMQDCELGEIPEGWEVSPLSKSVEILGGGTPRKSEPSYWGGDICWFSVKDVPDDGNIFVIETNEKITSEGLNKSSTRILPLGTTIITARGTVGKLALTGVETAMNQSCYGVIGNDGTGPYLNYLRMNQAVETLKRNTHGAVFDTITRSTFDTVIQVQATPDLRTRFESTISPLFLEIKSNLHQMSTLSEIRKALLPRLLSGELSVGTEEPSSGKVEQDEAKDLNALIEQIESDLPPKSYFMVRERPPREFENIRAIGFMTKVTGSMGEGGGEYLKLPTFLRKLRQNPILEKVFATAVDGVTGIPLFMDGVTAILNKYLGKKIKFDQKTAIVLLAFPKEVVRKTSELLNKSYELSKNAGLEPIDEDQLQRSLSWLQSHRLIYPLNDKHQEWRLVDKFRHEINNWD